jgi:ATP-dependent DNA helicase RecG
MDDNEMLKIFLETQEWRSFECKRDAIDPSKLLETVVAFANTDGGLIVIGLEDPNKEQGDKRLIGISENLDNVSNFLKLIEKEIEPPLIAWNKYEIDIININKVADKLLVVKIEKGRDICSLKKGDTFVRNGSQNTKIGSTEIIRLKYEKGSIKYENEKSDIKDLIDLDNNLFGQFKKDTSSESLDNWQFLKDNGLAIQNSDGYELTKAGVLLFGENPSVLLKSKCGIKISHYYGVRPSFSGKPNLVSKPITIEGPLLKQIEGTMKYFKEEIVKKSSPKLLGASFKSTFMVPEWAFQEAVANAVIHRNYSIQNDIQIRFFDDRIEIESPGTYPGHITVSNIRNERFARNPIILRALNRFQSAPNLDIGEGVDRIYEMMKERNLYDPFYIPPAIKPNSVLLVLFNLQRIEYWDTVSKYLDNNYWINNQLARKITGVEDTLKMSRYFKEWTEKGLLQKVNSNFKGNVFYKKVGVTVPRTINTPFSRGYENGNDKAK